MNTAYMIFILLSLASVCGAVSELNEISSILDSTAKQSTGNNSSKNSNQLEAIAVEGPHMGDVSASDQAGTLQQPFTTSQRIPEEQRLYPPGYKRKAPYKGPLKNDELPEPTAD